MKLCFSTLGCTEMSLCEILTLANDYGISAIEIRGIGGIMDNASIPELSLENTDATLSLLRRSSVTPAILGTSCSFHDPSKYEKNIREGETALEIAKRLGIYGIRVFGNRCPEDDPQCIERVASALRHLCRYAPDTQVLLEIHGDFNRTETVAPLLDLMKDEKNFGLIWDIEHSHKIYGKNWFEFYSAIRPYIHHIHVKDFSDRLGAHTLIGEGDVPVTDIAAQLIKDGYDRYFSLEWEKKWHPELPEFPRALDSFLATMSTIKEPANQ